MSKQSDKFIHQTKILTLHFDMKKSRLHRSSVHSRANSSGAGTPEHNRDKLKEKEKFSEDVKLKYIQELEQRNRKLKYEIIKINEMLDEHKDKVVVKKQHKLIPNESSAQVLKKELENVYKLIKNYEHEINALETKHSGGLITDKMARMETILSEKSKHLTKLKSQLAKLNKESLDNSKKLKNNCLVEKERTENMLLKYNDEIKVLRDRVRNAEEREKKKIENAKKQYEHIKRLEKELMENGVAMDEIDDLKKNNIYVQIYDKLNNPDREMHESTVSPQKSLKASNVKPQPKQEIEDMTLDRYMELKNETKLFKKLHEDYQKKLDALEKEKNSEEKLTEISRKKLKDKLAEMKQAQTEVGELKAKIRNNTVKANYQPPPPEVVVKKQKPKMPMTKLKQVTSSVKEVSQDQTHIKYDQKGKVSTKGERFTDRSMMGKTPHSKICALKVWTEKNSNIICGIQCGYKINGSVKYGDEHISKECKKLCTENLMNLPDGDYIKNISGHLSTNNIIEYLVFISKESMIGRFGVAKPTQKQFNYDIEDDELPICMYGSLVSSNTNIEGVVRAVSLIEQLGFEVTRDKSYGADMM